MAGISDEVPFMSQRGLEPVEHSAVPVRRRCPHQYSAGQWSLGEVEISGSAKKTRGCADNSHTPSATNAPSRPPTPHPDIPVTSR